MLKTRFRISIFKFDHFCLPLQMYEIIRITSRFYIVNGLQTRVCKKVRQLAYFQIRNLDDKPSLLGYSLSTYACIITSRLDNGNVLLNGISEQQLKKLQLVQNYVALVFVCAFYKIMFQLEINDTLPLHT